jgi:hypothetical protein
MTEVSQEEFEHKLMELLLQGDHPTLAVLRQQYSSAKVIRREFSGVGFFTTFEVSENSPKVTPENITGGNVVIELENLPNGAGCVLFVRDGKLSFLECYTFTDPWPNQIVIKSLSHSISLLVV